MLSLIFGNTQIDGLQRECSARAVSRAAYVMERVRVRATVISTGKYFYAFIEQHS